VVEEGLPDRRQRLQRHRPEHLLVLRRVTPPKEVKALGLCLRLQQRHRLLRLGLVLGEEGHGHAAAVRRFALEIALRLVQLPRHGRHDARAIARHAVAAAAAAVLHAAKRMQGARDRLVPPASLLVGDEADAARVALRNQRHRPRLREAELPDYGLLAHAGRR